MVSIKSLIASSFVLFQVVQSYCIYNQLTDGSAISVYQGFARTAANKVFSKRIEPGGKECCPYTTKDCSRRTTSTDPAYFYVNFHWPTISTNRYVVECTTGGGLSFVGVHQNHQAYCTDAHGNVKRVAITTDAV